MSFFTKQRQLLLADIALSELKLARMDWQEVCEEAYPYIANGELLPEDIRVQLHDAHLALENAKERMEKAEGARQLIIYG